MLVGHDLEQVLLYALLLKGGDGPTSLAAIARTEQDDACIAYSRAQSKCSVNNLLCLAP